MDTSSSSSPSLPTLPLSKSSHGATRKRISSHSHSSSAGDRRAPGDRRSKHHRSKDILHESTRELARLLAYEEREVKELQRLLYNATEQLKIERQRADDADRKALEAAYRFRSADNARIIAEQNAARVNEELRLYKIQLDNAQKEIFRAQEVLSTVDHQRHEAEEDAARARSTARALKEEKLVQIAREEGRRMGMEEGIERGRDIGYEQGRAAGYEQGRSRTEHFMERIFHDQDMHSGTHYQFSEGGVIPQTPVLHSPSSPRHVDVPPDNWIPEQDVDAVIRLPPPHEMTRPIMSRSPSPPLPPVPVEAGPVLMIPAPPHSDQGYGSDTSRRPGRTPLRSTSPPQSESSTRTSELDLLTAPQPTTRAFTGDRLSVIPEAASAECTPSLMTMKTSSTPIFERQPSIRESESGSKAADPSTTRMADYYRRPRSPTEESTRRPAGHSTAPDDRRSGSSSFNTIPDINIEPPSRPQSNNSREVLDTASKFLSPADANRPVPLPSDKPTSSSRTQPAAPSIAPNLPSGTVAPIILPDGQLPPGFVPLGPPIPETPGSRSNVIYGAGPNVSYDSGYTAALPSGFRSMADQYMSLSNRISYRDLHDADPLPATMPVIPPPSANYPDSDDDIVSSSSSGNTLSTPPPRRHRITRQATYPAAPGVVYPQMADTGGIPVPPPGGGVPRMNHHTAVTRNHAGGTPASSNTRPLSTHIDLSQSLSPNTQALRASDSKHSLRSSGSHKHFDRESYLDPAFLASPSVGNVADVGAGKTKGG